MNLFNRLLIIILTLLIMAGSVLLLAQTILGFSIGLPIWLTEQYGLFIGNDFATRLIMVGVFLVSILLGAVLLYIELLPIISPEPRFLITKDELGKVEVTRNCIGKFVNHSATLCGGVSAATSQIVKKNDGLHIKSSITINSEAELFEIGQTLQNQIKDGLEKKFGLTVSEVIIEATINPSRRKLV